MNISDLEPKQLWTNFEKICTIPHPSKKEDRLIQYVKAFGEELGLKTIADETGNVIIQKPATPGMENRMGVVLQGHLDMVPQKNTDTTHDFEKDAIQAYIDGEWIMAKGTTLGADNGIGVAAALSILQSKDIPHGPLEALFTIDEETGMTGAFGLKPGILKGDILLNMDSEDEGELFIGCAGGMDANISMTYRDEKVHEGFISYHLKLTGLKGGHSGLDIHLGKGNANKLLFRFLKNASESQGIRIATVSGGNLRNAIPREAFATIIVPSEKQNDFLANVKSHKEIYKNELSVVEPELNFEAAPTDTPVSIMDTHSQELLIKVIYGCPNGVLRMSDTMPGIVETSNNLAIVKIEKGTITVNCLMRSSVDSAKWDLAYMIQSIFELASAKVSFEGEYPGWKPNINSPILNLMKDVYKKKFNKIPEVKVIHAGLECGILGAIYPHWDMVSFGPTIRAPHSPGEKVNIKSVNKFWEFLTETLINIPNIDKPQPKI
ncbi:MAG: aminoacyl-histidine dipeptidase [Bacteroidia bacterium]|nr:aminoacyl-histidine dipeptidase [Bacteroidia bacterium]